MESLKSTTKINKIKGVLETKFDSTEIIKLYKHSVGQISFLEESIGHYTVTICNVSHYNIIIRKIRLRADMV